MKHIKRAVKKNATQWALFKDKIEGLMDREPLISYDGFCTGLMRKHEQIVAEEAQEAALNTETKQEANHKLNENESALYSKTNKGRRRQSGNGKGRGGGKGDYPPRQQWQNNPYYYGKGGGKGYKPNNDNRSTSYYNGGYRFNGGRGHGAQYYGSKNGGKGMLNYESSGKGNTTTRKFAGNCNLCGKYGHKEVDCYSKKTKM